MLDREKDVRGERILQFRQDGSGIAWVVSVWVGSEFEQIVETVILVLELLVEHLLVINNSFKLCPSAYICALLASTTSPKFISLVCVSVWSVGDDMGSFLGTDAHISISFSLHGISLAA